MRDANGQALSYVYYESERGRRSAAKLLSEDEARRIAVNIAKLPELLLKPWPFSRIVVRSATIVLVVCVFTGPAFALEPVGCDKFKWPLDKERATLNGTDLPKLISADRVAWPIPWATTLALVPFADAKLPVAPERAPKSPETFAGFIQVVAPAQAGTYKVTLSSEGWIDVAQDGHVRKSLASSGATGCEGVRKSVKFELAAAPFIIEISGATVHTIAIVVTPE